jgi:hypothetical protein
MKAKQIEERLAEMASHFTFDYNGKTCGVDPLSRTRYEMWYGDTDMTASSLDEVMTTPFFNGKSLTDIADEIKIDEY